MMVLMEFLCFSRLVFTSFRYFTWLGQMRLAIPVLTGIINVLQIRREFLAARLLLRWFEALLLQLIWKLIINAGGFSYKVGILIMFLTMNCLAAICKLSSHLVRYYKMRILMTIVVIGLLLILQSCEVLPSMDAMDNFITEQVSCLKSFMYGLMVNKKIRQQPFVFTSNPAFGGRGEGVRRTLRGGNKTFDATLGFPGEGWEQLSMATWNTRSLTFERLQYCKKLGFDILALTELWRNQTKYLSKSVRFTTSSPKLNTKGPNKGEMRFPKDKAAGVGILLSVRAQNKLMDFGSEGERVCYVRLKGPVCNLFVIAVYLPHRGRVQPNQDDTLRDLETVLAKVPKRDCVCIMGDLNEQLEGGVQDRTGKWVAGPKTPNADKIMQLLQLHELTAMNTTFQPKRKSALHTFLQTKKKEQDTTGDYGEHVGASVRIRYKNE